MRIYQLILIMLIVVSTSVIAEGQFAISAGKIVTIRSYGLADTADQPTYIQVEGGIRETCSHQNLGKGDLSMFVVLPEEKNLYSLLLSAYMAGKEVVITTNDKYEKKHNGACRVVYVDVRN